jgi:hypothetical protein
VTTMANPGTPTQEGRMRDERARRVAVDFIVRSDATTKFGGDTYQVAQYLEHFPRDVDARIIDLASPLRPNAIAHIVNLDRTLDFLAALSKARGHAVVVSPIHHLKAHVDRINGRRPLSLRKIAEGILPDGPKEGLQFLRRTRRPRLVVREIGAVPLLSQRSRAAMVSKALEGQVEAVVLLASGEGRSLTIDYGWPGTARVVIAPNGLPPARHQDASRDVDILVPGRIEARKNQLAVASALSGKRYHCVFVGAASPNDEAYVRSFAGVVKRSTNISWVPGVAPDEMTQYYLRSKVVLNLSMVEVQSLVDLEAVAHGCRLLGTSRGHSAELLGDYASFWDPEDVDGAIDLVEDWLEDWSPVALDDELRQKASWSRSAQVLTALYRSLSQANA